MGSGWPASIAAARRADGLGRSSAKQWEDLDATLRKFGVLNKPVVPASVFAGGIIDSLYDAQGRLK